MNSDYVGYIPIVDCSRNYAVDDNIYENIYLDITHRCNMHCSYCYNPQRLNIDMSIEYFEEVCKRLPNRVNFKLLGGEPTLHEDLFKFITIAQFYGHGVFFASNGIKYNNAEFMSGLSKLSDFYPGLSMDGGHNRNSYQVINDSDCVDQKLKALGNLIKHDVKGICLSAVIVRGVNEFAIEHLIELAKSNPRHVEYIHFRNAGKVGKWVDIEPYSMNELKDITSRYCSESEMEPRCIGEIHCSQDSGNTCCYRFRPTNKLQISLVEFATVDSANCHKRGKLLNDFTIQPFFENMLNVSDAIQL